MRYVVLTLLTLGLTAAALAQTKTTVTVGQGKGVDFSTVQQAIDKAPADGEIIRIAPGTYREKLSIETPNIRLIGMGNTPQQVVLSWHDSAKNAGGTSKSASVTVTADGFGAENLTIENTWELDHQRAEDRSQAVALLLSSDRAVLDHVRILGAQDTLYANSRTCHEILPVDGNASTGERPACQASRQFFRDCYVEGHVDYIFGDAKAVFQRCELHSLPHGVVTITAQSRYFPAEDSGYTFLHCRITGSDGGGKVFLGRPWRDYSTVTFYDTEFQQQLDPGGWSEWGDRLKTSTYREYNSHGPGVNDGHRIVISPPPTTDQERSLSPKAILGGSDNWNPEAEADLLRRLR